MTQPTAKPIIAVDIDDVVAGISGWVQLWANETTGSQLTKEDYRTTDDYWNYYDSIWERHGLSDRLSFAAVLEAMAKDQSGIPVIDGAREALETLKARYDLVFITSRPSYQKDETRQWLNERIDSDIPMYLAYNPMVDREARSKGEICAELGVKFLIDDNIANCESALEYGVEAILFGEYGWNEKASDHLMRCKTWKEAEDYLLHEAA